MKKLLQKVSNWLRSRVTAIMSEERRMKSEEVKEQETTFIFHLSSVNFQLKRLSSPAPHRRVHRQALPRAPQHLVATIRGV